MKEFISLIVIIYASMQVYCQNINGESTVCRPLIYPYEAVESAGNTHRKWLGVRTSELASGSLSNPNISIDFGSVGGSSLLLAWENDAFGFGGEMDIIIIDFDETDISGASDPLGSNSIEMVAYVLSDATSYQFEISGFGLSSNIYCNSSSNDCTTSVPDTDSSGSIRVHAYYSVCDFGSEDGWTDWSSWTHYPSGM